MLTVEKIEKSKEVLRLAAKMSKQYYDKPLVVAYSGGKDSDVLLHLAVECLGKEDCRFLNSHTTVDAPETVYHIRNVFNCLADSGWQTEIKKPNTTMWKLIVEKKMPPSRIWRYCCSELKEMSTPNQMCAVGVRAEESIKRRGRDVFSLGKKGDGNFSLDHAREVYEDAQDKDEIWDCKLITAAKKNKDIVVNPIYEWTHSDVWQYIRENNIKTNPLYERGFHRVGCVLCPMASKKEMKREMAMYPKIANAYERAFDRMLQARKEQGVDAYTWETGKDVFDWWIGTDQIDGQMELDFEVDE